MTLLEELASCLAMLRGSQLRLDRWMEDIRHDAAGELLLDEIEAQCAWFKPRFRVSEAAALANMHPQTLRQYDRLGLVVPGRTEGGTRRYSLRDLAHLGQVQHLSQDEGVNLAGIAQIMELQRRVEELEAENSQLALMAGVQNRVFAATSTGEVTSMHRGERAEKSAEVAFPLTSGSALVLWRGRQ